MAMKEIDLRTCCVRAGRKWNPNSKHARYKHKLRHPECPYLKEQAWLKEGRAGLRNVDPVHRKKFLKKMRNKRHRQKKWLAEVL